MNEKERLEKSTKYASDKEAAMELLKEIQRISEDRFSAGWMMHIEYDLWNALGGADYLVDGEDVLELKATEAWKLGVLHGRAGGWWYWVDGAGPTFTRTFRWVILVAAHERNTT